MKPLLTILILAGFPLLLGMGTKGVETNELEKEVLFSYIESLRIKNIPTVEYARKLTSQFYKKGKAKNSYRIGRSLYSEVFANRKNLDYERLEYVLFGRKLTITSKNQNNEYAQILGKTKISASGFGILVFTQGFHGITAIYLYPLLRDGGLGQGLLVADFYGDEGTRIEIKSEIDSSGELPRVRIELKLHEFSEDVVSEKESLKMTKIFDFEYEKSIGWKKIAR